MVNVPARLSTMRRMKRAGESILLPAGLFAFLRSLPPNPRILDIGCGNNSPQRVKGLRPDATYTGVDVGDHNQSGNSLSFADHYVIASSAEFANAIAALGAARFDGVISNHNLEHCEAPDAVLEAIAKVIAPGGRLFLAFPSEASVNFQSREGTLNFFDDPTHREVPSWNHVVEKLKNLQFEIGQAHPRYRPLFPAAIGLAFEPWAAATGKQAPLAGTWALYGFESILWATKLPAN